MDPFSFDKYLLVSRLRLRGRELRLCGPNGDLVLFGFANYNGSKLRIGCYSDESRSRELVTVTADRVQAFSDQPMAWQVTETSSGKAIGFVAREDLAGPERIDFRVLDADRALLGELCQLSGANAIVRRFVSMRLGATYELLVLGTPVATFHKRFNPFRFKMDVEFHSKAHAHIDRRLAIGTALLVAFLESPQML